MTENEFPQEEYAGQDVVIKAPGIISRGLLYLVLGVVIALILWSAVSRIDVTVTASAEVVPQGRIRAVQTPVAGIIDSISIREGTRVSRGDPIAVIVSDEIRSLRHDLKEAVVRQTSLEEEQQTNLPLKEANVERLRGVTLSQTAALDRRIANLRQQQTGIETELKLQQELATFEQDKRRNEVERLKLDIENAELNESIRRAELNTRSTLKSQIVTKEEIAQYRQEADMASNEMSKTRLMLLQLETDDFLSRKETEIERNRVRRQITEITDGILEPSLVHVNSAS